MQRHGWKSRYHDEVLVQGLAPHDLDGYLLQRDRWARGNLAVFTLPESPLRARKLKPLQRLSYFASLFAYLAPPMRLLLLVTLGLVLWTGALPLKISVLPILANNSGMMGETNEAPAPLLFHSPSPFTPPLLPWKKSVPLTLASGALTATLATSAVPAVVPSLFQS